jgi:LPXTG-motif cell wall-anchored protein
MDTRKFDDLTRSLAVGKSRRTVIKGLFGGAVGTIAVAGRPAYGVLAQPVGCGSDDQCDGDEICCEGTCAAIECCIGDADPNARCPEGTSCFEGVCDPVLGCGSDDQCAGDEICCEGVCAAIQCCIGDADPNARCPEGTSCFEGQCDALCEYAGCPDGQCCCPDQSCSADCCETPIVVLPATGSGSESEGGAWVAAAAIGGAAAYLAARKVRTPETNSAE